MNKKLELECYLEHKVNPIFEDILAEIIKERPKNIFTFCKQWFDLKLQTTRDLPEGSDNQSEEEEQYLNDKWLQDRKLKAKWYDQRRGICGEVYGGHHHWEEFELPVNNKKSTVNSRILFRLKQLFLFKNFDDNDIWRLINAMQEQTFEPGATVVRQGQTGNQIFIVDSGDLQCFKSNGVEDVYLKTIKQGEMFGEMAMLYNTPRTATVKVKTRSVLFKLDRKTFYSIVNEKNNRKRKVFHSVIQKIDIFRELQIEERYKIEDLIKQIPVHLNQYVIKEGKSQNKLYIVQSGKFVSIKKEKSGHQKVTGNFKENDYFGQIGLVSKKPASESVLALTNGRLYSIEVQSLERVIGPISNLIKRSIDVYERYRHYENS